MSKGYIEREVISRNTRYSVLHTVEIRASLFFCLDNWNQHAGFKSHAGDDLLA